MKKNKKTEKKKPVVEKKKNTLSFYHAEPRNPIEEMISKAFPSIASVYGFGKINLFFDTTREGSHICMNQDDEEREKGSTMFSINYRPNYKTAYIFVHPLAISLYKNGEIKMLKHGLVHEFGHILTEGLAELALSRFTTKREIEDQVEKTTETIAMMARELLSLKGPEAFSVK